jgi:hypothetical protein
VHAFLLLLVVGQTWVWTDAKGVEHYTDDRSTIPKGVTARTTEGAELAVMSSDGPVPDAGRPSSPRRAAADAGVGRAQAPVDTCEAARDRLTRLEGKLEEEKKRTEQARLIWHGDCQTVLNLYGDGAYAVCMAGGRRSRRSAQPPDPAVTTASIERELEQARDTLRRAQVAGCR